MALKSSWIFYSLEITSADYFLFPKLESELRRKRFHSNNDVMVPLDDLLGVPSSASFFRMNSQTVLTLVKVC